MTNSEANNRSVKVSVLTPLYNTNPVFLREMIESILNQTFRDFEFILLNDSPDNREIEEIVRSYQDLRIVYVKNESNLGISESRNKLLALSRGEYVAIFDHDDISCKERLEKQVDYLDSHREVGVVGCHIKRIPKNKITRFPVENLDIKRELIHSCAVPHTGSMIRKSVLVENAIGWESAYSPAEDYMLWVKLIAKTMFHNIPEVLIHYRSYESNTSVRQKEKMRDRDALIRCYAEKEYPFLRKYGQKNKGWVFLFGIVPLIKIRSKNEIVNYYLLGVIKLCSVKRQV